MRQEYSTLCTVSRSSGKPKVKIFDLADFDLALDRFADGVELELTIAEPMQKYTRAQEKFFHGPVLKAFMTLGNGKQEAKDMLALRFIPIEIRQMDGTIAIVPGHTSALSKEEYSQFIEECIQLAAENDIVIKDSADWLAERRREERHHTRPAAAPLGAEAE